MAVDAVAREAVVIFSMAEAEEQVRLALLEEHRLVGGPSGGGARGCRIHDGASHRHGPRRREPAGLCSRTERRTVEHERC